MCMSHASSAASEDFGATLMAARHAGLPPGSRLHEARLANGLRIAAVQVSDARLQRLVGAVGVGYLDEPSEHRGLAHLLEHALFLGSANFPGAGDLARWVGKRGGRYNARTDEHTTDFHLHLPPEECEEGLIRLVDMLARPCFKPELIAHEVEVLDAEFQARLADPALHRLAALGRLCRDGHPARDCHAGNRTTLGSDAAGLTDQLANFHACHYRSGRMALVMLGPLPLETQVALLERHATELPVGDPSPLQRTWRWDQPGGIAWQLPTPCRHTSALELFWPLSDKHTNAQASWLESIATRLADGHLAATLQAAVALDRLEISHTPTGMGAALAIQLSPALDEATLQIMFSACCTALEQALNTPQPVPLTAVHTPDLDAWPRRYACQLAACNGQTSEIDKADTPLSLLMPDQCRLLWRPPAIADNASSLAETETLWRPQPLPSVGNTPLAWRAPPTFERVSSPSSASSAGAKQPEYRHGVWIGEPVRLADAPPATLCLGWPAPASQRTARLVQWQRNSLSLRQTATACGMRLVFGNDNRGDWLIATGQDGQLTQLAEYALDCWPAQPGTQLDTHTPGLLAQRMLAMLDDSPPFASQHNHHTTPLAWLSSETETKAVQALLHQVATGTPHGASPSKMTATDHHPLLHLTPQSDEYGVMLEVAGPDNTTRSRWLLQLLAQSHDAAFQHEMRQQRGLGYAAAVRYREVSGTPRLAYVVQSPHADTAMLRHSIREFLVEQGAALARPGKNEIRQRKHGLSARAGPPETHAEATERLWQALRWHVARGSDTLPWQPLPWVTEAQTLAMLEPDDLTSLAHALVSGHLPQRWWLHIPH